MNANQRGISLVGAIFLITVVSLLAVALTRSIATSASATATDIQRMHALLAAEAGAQLGAYAAIGPSGSNTCTSQTIALGAFDLPACETQISCRVELVRGNRYYTIQSDAVCRDAGNIAAQRSVLVRLQDV